MLSELEPRLRRDLPKGHIAFASLASERSLLAQAKGVLSDALDLANQALAMAEASVQAGREGADYLPVLLARRSGIELQARNANAAVADAARALTLLQRASQPGVFSGTLGRTYLTLGRALRSQQKWDDARATLASAADHLQNSMGPDHPETREARQLADLSTKHK